MHTCQRFSSQNFEQRFTDYLKRLELFLVSEAPLKDYLELITSSEETKDYQGTNNFKNVRGMQRSGY